MDSSPSPLPQAEETTVETTDAAPPPQTGPLTGRPVTPPEATKVTIPVKKSATAFRTISEVADELNVQQHVLRFWETKFSQIRPLKRGGGRRYYRPEDVDLLKTIHRLLYSEGYTIKGVQKLFREKGKGQVVEAEHPKTAQNENFSEKQRRALQSIAGELRELRNLLGNG